MITGKNHEPTPQEVRTTAEAALSYLGKASAKAEIAFFGGSFTAVDDKYRRSLLEAAFPYVRDGRFAGIRLSTRPDAIDNTILDELCAYGVTTVELGAQSMNDAVLLKNGRGHTAEQVRTAAEMITTRGLRLGLQMMTGLPGDTAKGALYTAKCFAQLHPEEVRIYPTIVLPGTQLGQWYQAGEYQPETLEEAVSLCARLLQFFEEHEIRVIRLGLHASPQLEKERLAGPWHPAFRELCESRRWLVRIQQMLQGKPCGRYVVTVPEKYLSQVKGQKKANLSTLETMGWHVEISAGEEFRLLRAAGPASKKETCIHADPLT